MGCITRLSTILPLNSKIAALVMPHPAQGRPVSNTKGQYLGKKKLANNEYKPKTKIAGIAILKSSKKIPIPFRSLFTQFFLS